MMRGYSLTWIAYDLGVSPRTIHRWMANRFFADLPHPGRGRGASYSRDFVARARRVHALYQRFPCGPADLIRDMLTQPEDDES